MNRQKPRRKRGVILTTEGFHKLRTAKCQAESWENSDQRYTLEQLRLRTGLDPDTLMKVFRCEVGVDKQTLNCCFKAFNLRLEASDYQLAHIENSIQNLESQIVLIGIMHQMYLFSTDAEQNWRHWNNG